LTKLTNIFLGDNPIAPKTCPVKPESICNWQRVIEQPVLMKLLWAGHPARPKNTNMTFMNLISEFNELTLTESS